jgi:hypothetical protein
MQRELLMSRLLDNHTRGAVGDFLREKIRADADLSVVSAYFTIYAYDALKTQLDQVRGMRFLFGEPSFIKSLDPTRQGNPGARIERDELKLEQQLRQSRVARACADWISDKVEVRSRRRRKSPMSSSRIDRLRSAWQKKPCGFLREMHPRF